MRPLILEAGAVAAAAITTLKTDVVGPGQIFKVLSVMARDETTAIANWIEIGLYSGTRLIPIDCTAGNFAALVSHTVYWPFVVPQGMGVYARFNIPTSGDNLVLVAAGYAESIAHDRHDQSEHSKHGNKGR